MGTGITFKLSLAIGVIGAAHSFPSPTSAQIAGCDPLAWARSGGIPGPFSTDEFALVKRNEAIAAEGDISKLPKDFGKGYVYRNYWKCRAQELMPTDRALKQTAREMQMSNYVRAFGRRAMTIAGTIGLGPLGVGAELLNLPSPIAEYVLPDREDLLKKFVGLAYANAVSRGDIASFKSVYANLRSELNNPGSAIFFGLSEETKRMLRDAAAIEFAEAAVKSPEELTSEAKQQKWIESLIGLDGPLTRNDLSELQDLRNLSDAERARLGNLDNRAKQAAEAKVALIAKFEATIRSANDTGGKVTKVANDATADAGAWKEARAILSPAARDNPEIQISEASALLTGCSDTIKDRHCVVGALLKEDGEKRKSAVEFGRKAKETRDVAKNAAVALSHLGAHDAARWATAVYEVSNSAAEVAFELAGAVGPLGPVAWLSISTQLLNLGGSLGSTFGGGSAVDADAARHEQIMEALQKISEQIADLRELTLREFGSQRVQSQILTEYAKVTLGITVANEEDKGLVQCLTVAKKIHENGIATRTQFINRFERDGEVANKLPKCASWLMHAGGRETLVQSSGVNALFRLDTTLLVAAYNTAANRFEPGVAQAFRSDLDRTAIMSKSLLLLAEHALESKGGLGALILPVLSLRQIDKLGISGPVKFGVYSNNNVVELGKLLKTMWPAGAGREEYRFQSFLGNALDTVRIVNILSVAMHLRNSMEAMKWSEDFNQVESVEQDPNDSVDARVKKSKNGWLWYLAPLGYLAIAQETLERGDYIVPLVGELLENKEKVSRCILAPPDNTKSDLCARFGRTDLEALTEAAQIVVQQSPYIRANVALWRVRRALLSLPGAGNSEYPDGRSYRPSYGVALQQTSGDKLRELLPGVIPVRIEESAVPNDFVTDLVKDHRWFLRLSGECSGLTDIALNARAVCPSSGCEAASIKVDAAKKWNYLPDRDLERPAVEDAEVQSRWMQRRARVCVLAPLPSQATLEEGAYISPPEFDYVIATAGAFISTATYYFDLQEKADKSDTRDAFLKADLIKPPNVPVWRIAD